MVGPHHSYLRGDTLRFNCMEHSSFHSYCSTSVPIFLVLRLALVSTLICVESLFSFLYLCLISSLYFVENYLWELFQISWLVLEASKMFSVYIDANGSLFWLWHRPWLVMLYVILHVLVIIVLAWLVLNNWECFSVPLLVSCFVSIKHKLVVFSIFVSYGLTWHMLTPCYDYKSQSL